MTINEHTASDGSSSYAPVEFGGPVPSFSRNTTLSLIPTDAMRGYHHELITKFGHEKRRPYNNAAEKLDDRLIRRRKTTYRPPMRNS